MPKKAVKTRPADAILMSKLPIALKAKEIARAVNGPGDAANPRDPGRRSRQNPNCKGIKRASDWVMSFRIYRLAEKEEEQGGTGGSLCK